MTCDFADSRIIYFTPHQDDEIATMGASIMKSLAVRETYLVLCTDGRNCETRTRLSDKKFCKDLHDTHEYSIDKPTYSSLRDVEFLDSAQALGLPSDHIILADPRMIDGEATTEDAKAIMRSVLSAFPSRIIGTHLPAEPPTTSFESELKQAILEARSQGDTGYGFRPQLDWDYVADLKGDSARWGAQHPDHRAIGYAALELLEAGEVDKVEFNIEPYFLAQFVSTHPGVSVGVHALTPDEYPSFARAIDAYCTWSPVDNRFALGYHSAKDLLNRMRRHPYTHTITVTRDTVNLIKATAPGDTLGTFVFEYLDGFSDSAYDELVRYLKLEYGIYQLRCCENHALTEADKAYADAARTESLAENLHHSRTYRWGSKVKKIVDLIHSSRRG